MDVKSLRKQLMAAIAMVVVAAVALSSATYAWFVNNTQVTATNVNVTASTAYSLRISDGERTAFGTTTELNTALTELRPASTVNLTNFFKSDAWDGTGKVKTFTALTDDTAANGVYKDANDDTYVYYDKVSLLAGQECTVYLDSTYTGIGLKPAGGTGTLKSFTDSSLNDNQKALLQMMRIGLKVTQKTTDGATANATRTYVFQLDSTKDTGAANKPDYITTIDGAEGLTKATDSATTVGNIVFTNVGTGVPAIADWMKTGDASALIAKDATHSLATMNANEILDIEIYVWMEGCDENCTSAEAQKFNNDGSSAIIQNLQLGFCAGDNA